MRDAVWVHLQEVPLDYTRRRGPGRLLVRFISDTRAVQRLVSQGMVQLIQDVLFVIGAITVLTYLNLLVGLSTTLLLPLIVLVFWRINPRVQQASRDTRNRRTRLSGYLNARLTGLAVVKIHGRQREEAKHVRKLNHCCQPRRPPGCRRWATAGSLSGHRPRHHPHFGIGRRRGRCRKVERGVLGDVLCADRALGPSRPTNHYRQPNAPGGTDLCGTLGTDPRRRTRESARGGAP